MEQKKSKIPKNAKCVFKGKIFDVYQWQQEMFDGSIETFEALKRPDTAIVITVVGDKILIQIQKQPNIPESFYSFPGGRIEENEVALAGAKRELLEETGYGSGDWTLFDKFSPVSKIEWTVYAYIAKGCQKIAEPNLDAGEQISTELITFDELIDLSQNPTFYKKELTKPFLLAKFDPTEKEKLRKLLFN